MNTKQTTWNLALLFSGDDDPKMAEDRKMVEEKSYQFIEKWKNKKEYLSDPALLAEALSEYEEWQRNYGTDGKEGFYFWLRTSQDNNDPKIKAKFNKISDFSKKIHNDMMFFELGIAKIPESEQKRFLEAEELKDYKHFLENIFQNAKYLLSEPEEKILALKSDTSHSNWVDMTEAFLAKEEREVERKDGKKEIKNFSELLSLISDKDKKARDAAAAALNDILEKNADVAEYEINSVLADKKTNDELRKMPRPDTSRHISDDIDSEVVDVLLDAVTSEFDIAKRFYELKAKLFGVKKLQYHERTVPYGKVEKEYSYEEAVDLVHGVFVGLDQKFADIFKEFVEGGHIDVFPKKGKSSGAFCAYHLPSQPTYLLLNHTGKLRDVTTIAHEVGHGINDEMMKEKQNALNFGTPMSTAEVASTFMEDFVTQEILKEADDELRLSLTMSKLDDEISTIFRQVACYNFEKELHETFRKEGYLSKEDIGRIFQKHMSSYMGDFVEMSEGSQNWWVYWSHIRNFFYVYSYASGLLISKFMQSEVKKDHSFIEKVKDFLSAGLSDSPKNIFAKMGIDITDRKFWEEGVKETEKLLKETEELARKLGKI